MAVCLNCGMLIGEHHRFCESCGQAVKELARGVGAISDQKVPLLVTLGKELAEVLWESSPWDSVKSLQDQRSKIVQEIRPICGEIDEDHWGVHLVLFFAYGSLAWEMENRDEATKNDPRLIELVSAALQQYLSFRRTAPNGLPVFNPQVDLLAIMLERVAPGQASAILGFIKPKWFMAIAGRVYFTEKVRHLVEDDHFFSQYIGDVPILVPRPAGCISIWGGVGALILTAHESEKSDPQSRMPGFTLLRTPQGWVRRSKQ